MKWNTDLLFEGRKIQVLKKADGNHSVIIPGQLNYTVLQEGDVWTLYITVDAEKNLCEKVFLDEKTKRYGFISSKNKANIYIFKLSKIKRQKSVYIKTQAQYLLRLKKFIEKKNL